MTTDSKIIIDMNEPPSIPEGWTLVDHRTYARSRTNLEKLDSEQLCFNANLLDFFLENQDLIPETFKDKYVPFFDTLYKNEENELCFRFLVFDKKLGWIQGYMTNIDGVGKPHLFT